MLVESVKSCKIKVIRGLCNVERISSYCTNSSLQHFSSVNYTAELRTKEIRTGQILDSSKRNFTLSLKLDKIILSIN
jgi:hypothetical protein